MPTAIGFGRSHIAMGPAASLATLGAGLENNFTYDPQEDGRLGKLGLQARESGLLGTTPAGIVGLHRLTVIEMKWNNDSLISGVVPAVMFAPDSQCNPVLGHPIDKSSKVSVKVRNEDATTITDLSPSFTLGPYPGQEEIDAYKTDSDDTDDDAINRMGLSHVAIGPAAVADLAAAAEVTYRMEINEQGRLGFLCLNIPRALGGDIRVTSIKVDNDELLTGEVEAGKFQHDSTSNPAFGHFIERQSKIDVTLRNDGAGTLPDVAPAFSLLPI